jgi:hypothetical protein
VGLWLFNETGGLKAYDLSGKHNDGTLITAYQGGPTWKPGKFGQALSFNGTIGYVSMNDSSSLRVQDHTISAWIKKNVLDITITQVILVKRRGGINLYSYDLEIYATGDVIRYVLHDGVTAKDWISNTAIANTNWNNVVSTYAGTQMSIYLNGIYKESTTSGLNPIAYADDKLFVGSWTEANNNFDGLIDNVRIYKRALSAKEIRWLYQDPFAGIDVPIFKDYWPEVAAGGPTGGGARYIKWNPLGFNLIRP